MAGDTRHTFAEPVIIQNHVMYYKNRAKCPHCDVELRYTYDVTGWEGNERFRHACPSCMFSIYLDRPYPCVSYVELNDEGEIIDVVYIRR